MHDAGKIESEQSQAPKYILEHPWQAIPFTKGATDSTNTVSFKAAPDLTQVHIILQGSKDLRTWQEKRHKEEDGDTEPYRSRVTKRRTQVT
jgi:hypothetical protein